MRQKFLILHIFFYNEISLLNSFNMSIKQTNITTNKKELEFNITFKCDIAGSGYKMKGLY